MRLNPFSQKLKRSSTPLIWFHHTDAGARGTLRLPLHVVVSNSPNETDVVASKSLVATGSLPMRLRCRGTSGYWSPNIILRQLALVSSKKRGSTWSK